MVILVVEMRVSQLAPHHKAQCIRWEQRKQWCVLDVTSTSGCVQRTPAAHLVTGIGFNVVVVVLLESSAPVAVACNVFCFFIDDEGGGLPSFDFEGQSISVE